MIDRQQAALDRLRAKGNHLAPVMVDGRVRPKQAAPRPAQAALTPSRTLGEVITPTRTPNRSTGHTEPFELIIPAPCDWLNSNQRLHWAPKAERTSAWRDEGRRSADFANAPIMIARCRIDAYVRKPVRNKFDPANWYPTAKAVVDGLNDYGLFEDDNWQHVEGPFMHDGGKGEPALRLVITPLQTNVTAA